MQSSGLGKGLSALIPNDIKKDFQKDESSKVEVKYDKKKMKGQGDRIRVEFEDDKENEIDLGLELDGKSDEVKASKKNNKKTFKKAKTSLPGVIEIELSKIVVNKNQPRRDFDQDKLESLAKSINQHGLLNPITVKKMPNKDIYEIVAGERRFRASNLAGLKEIPAIVRDVDRKTQLELALIENIQREDLNPIEEAIAYRTLIKEFGLTQSELAERIQKGRSSVANTMRLLSLPEEVQEGLALGKINEAHAKLLLSLPDPNEQLEIYEKVVKHNLTVKNLERIIKTKEEVERVKVTVKEDPLIMQREKRLSDSLGLKVKIKPRQDGGGKILLEYFNQDDLSRLMSIINREEEEDL